MIKSYGRRDLVVLVQAQNECYLDVLSVNSPKLKECLCSPSHPGTEERGIVLDMQKGTWSTKHDSTPYKIGENYLSYLHNSTHRIIGVFDRTDINHLRAMVSAAREYSREP